MMWFKDQVFGGKLEEQILAESDPREIKALGRRIQNFIPSVWDAISRAAVYRGNMAKFIQRDSNLQLLFSTAGSTLVEASPKDKLWGIGLTADDPLALSRATWKGKNWLGEVLTQVREDLLFGRNVI